MATATVDTETGEVIPTTFTEWPGLPDNLSSSRIGDLHASIAAARPNFAEVKKSKTAKIKHKEGGGSHSYKYATLDDIIEAVGKPLAAEGVGIYQPSKVVKDGVVVRTFLVKADQWISDYGLFQPANTRDAKSIGSAITYGRRYALTSLLNIPVEEDTDGEGAVAPPPPKDPPKATKKQKDDLAARIAALGDAHRQQIKDTMAGKEIPWETIDREQLQTVTGWVSVCEKVEADAAAAEASDMDEAAQEAAAADEVPEEAAPAEHNPDDDIQFGEATDDPSDNDQTSDQ